MLIFAPRRGGTVNLAMHVARFSTILWSFNPGAIEWATSS
jgi:hypothetical protein